MADKPAPPSSARPKPKDARDKDSRAKVASDDGFVQKRLTYATARGEFSVCAWDGKDSKAHPKAARPILHFAHATGFHGATYGPLLAALSDQFRVRAWDARGHGKTRAPLQISGHAAWDSHRDDLLAVLEALAKESKNRLYLAGHSMGATISFMAAAERPSWVAGLLLVEPIMRKPPYYAAKRMLANLLGLRLTPIARAAARRRAIFPDVDAMYESYRQRGAFRTWEDVFLRAYLSAATRRHAEGVELACPPKYEAALFNSFDHDPLAAASQIAVPFSVLLGEEMGVAVQTQPFFQALGPGKIKTVPATTHFLPMESPESVREEIRRLPRRAALYSSDGALDAPRITAPLPQLAGR